MTVKQSKAEKRKYKENSYLLVLESKIQDIYKKKTNTYPKQKKKKLNQTNKT